MFKACLPRNAYHRVVEQPQIPRKLALDMKFGRLRLIILICALSLPHAEMWAAERQTSKTSAKTPARLIVQRAPNFGTSLVVRLSIDGTKVADIPRNQTRSKI